METYNILCIGGGGIYGLNMLGALYYLDQHNLLKYENIETFIGTSIGAVIVMLLSIGFSIMDIFRSCNLESLYTLKDILTIKTSDYGLLDITKFLEVIKKLILQKFEVIPTLSELFEKTGKELIIVTTNVNKNSTIFISYHTHPEMLILDAIQLSCALPFIFKRCDYEKERYVDGGILNNFPIDYPFTNNVKNIIGVYVDIVDANLENYIEYIYRILTLASAKIQNINIENIKADKQLLIKIKPVEAIPIDFNISKNKRDKLFCEGYLDAKVTMTGKLLAT